MVVDTDTLTVAERIQLVQDLWDSIAAHPEEIPVTPEELGWLDERLASYERDSSQGVPWETLKAKLLRQA